MTSRRPHPTETKPLERSAFYQLKSRRTLATLLGISLPQLELLARDADSLYARRLAKKRSVQVPKGALRRVHVRIFELLRRIETPDYLHSGIRSRSYVTNAASKTIESRWEAARSASAVRIFVSSADLPKSEQADIPDGVVRVCELMLLLSDGTEAVIQDLQ